MTAWAQMGSSAEESDAAQRLNAYKYPVIVASSSWPRRPSPTAGGGPANWIFRLPSSSSCREQQPVVSDFNGMSQTLMAQNKGVF